MSVLVALDGLTRLEMANNQLQIIPDDIGNIKCGRCLIAACPTLCSLVDSTSFLWLLTLLTASANPGGSCALPC